jgi:hypothetical protein
MTRRRALLPALLAPLVLGGCLFDSAMTPAELTTWYEETAPDSPHKGPLWYRGTDQEFHYFMCRVMDRWVESRVVRADLEIPFLRPALRTSGGPFPGHYAVDPSRGYVMVSARSD